MDEAVLEHRLTAIEGAITSAAQLQAAELRTLAIEVSGMKQQVTMQNGRISILESWRQFATGLKEGRAEIGKGQLAILAVAGPLLFAAINLAVSHWH